MLKHLVKQPNGKQLDGIPYYLSETLLLEILLYIVIHVTNRDLQTRKVTNGRTESAGACSVFQIIF